MMVGLLELWIKVFACFLVFPLADAFVFLLNIYVFMYVVTSLLVTTLLLDFDRCKRTSPFSCEFKKSHNQDSFCELAYAFLVWRTIMLNAQGCVLNPPFLNPGWWGRAQVPVERKYGCSVAHHVRASFCFWQFLRQPCPKHLDNERYRALIY